MKGGIFSAMIYTCIPVRYYTCTCILIIVMCCHRCIFKVHVLLFYFISVFHYILVVDVVLFVCLAGPDVIAWCGRGDGGRCG